MALKLITPPAEEPITLADAKLHLKVDSSDEDAMISALIVAARQQAEHRTGRVLITQTWELALDAFPDGEIELQKVPAASISSVKYLDESAVEQTIAAINYGMDNYGLQHWLFPAAGYEWPIAISAANSVKVRYIAGYGDATAVPESIKTWMKLAIGTWHVNREALITGTFVQEFPDKFFDGLLDPYRVYW